MDHRDIYPTCVLKVNLGCCKTCVVRLKKLLSTIDGVYGYDIDSEKGRVTVLGRAHPQLLVEKIRQKKKKAVVVSYEKPTPNAKTKDSSNTKEDERNGDLDSKPKESKKKHGNGDQKGFKKEDIFGHHESDPHEFEAYVPPKPSALDTCRDPYCKLHHKKPVIIRPSDNVPKVMLQPPLNHPRFLPPPPWSALLLWAHTIRAPTERSIRRIIGTACRTCHTWSRLCMTGHYLNMTHGIIRGHRLNMTRGVIRGRRPLYRHIMVITGPSKHISATIDCHIRISEFLTSLVTFYLWIRV